MYIAERLKNERTKLKVNKKDLAELINVDAGTISKLERGAYNTPRETVEKVCNKLGFHEDEFEEEYTAGNRQFDQRIFFGVVSKYYKKISEQYFSSADKIDIVEKIVPKTTKNFKYIKCYLENGNLYNNGSIIKFNYNKKFEKLIYDAIIRCNFKPSIIFIINLFIELRAMNRREYTKELMCLSINITNKYLNYSVENINNGIYNKFLEESRKYILDFITKRDVCLKRPIWKFIYDYLMKYDKNVDMIEDINDIKNDYIKNINNISIDNDYSGILDFEFFDKLIEKSIKREKKRESRNER